MVDKDLLPSRTSSGSSTARHLNGRKCGRFRMSMRGIRKPGAKTVTSAVRGELHDRATRAEAMSLILAR